MARAQHALIGRGGYDASSVSFIAMHKISIHHDSRTTLCVARVGESKPTRR
jgi:hypothetical protein